MTDILNFYKKIDPSLLDKVDNPNFKNHGLSIPMRMLITAPSGAGKTNTLCNIIKLFSKPQGTFSTITIITRNKNEPLYNYLEDVSKGNIVIKEGLQNLNDLDKYDKQVNHLVVIDDMVLEKNQTPIIEYFIRARKQNVSIIYISQSYYAVPKLIRQNINYLIILRLSGQRNINMILSECQLGIEKKELIKIYENCTSKKFHFLLLDLNEDEDKRYRCNFKIIDVKKYLKK